MPSTTVVLALALLLGIQPVATDLYLPALPAITTGFGAGMAQAQLTLTALLLAFGVSQLVWGPLSDRIGRRPVLLWGLTGFTLASIGSVFAASMEQLLVWRAIQGAAMGASVMCARAIVRDVYAPTEGARMMSKGLTGLGVIACLSAPLGGLLAQWLGWRFTLAALAVFGASALAFVVLKFQETLAQPNPKALQPREMLRIWRTIVRHPTYWTYTLLAATSYCGLFTFLATSSFVFIDVLGESKAGYGLLMLSMTSVYIVGTFMCRRLIPRLGIRKTVAVAGALSLTGGTCVGVLGWLGIAHTWAIMGPYYLFILAHGVHQPCGQSGSVAPFPTAAGAASALSGFTMMVAAFLMGTWLGVRTAAEGIVTVRPLTDGLWFWGVAIAAVAWTLVQRYGEPRTPPTPTPAAANAAS